LNGPAALVAKPTGMTSAPASSCPLFCPMIIVPN
jgi:hypothetical protein